MPVLNKKERRLFTELMLKQGRSVDYERLALQWVDYVNGHTIHCKLPVYLRQYAKVWKRNSNIQNAVQAAKSGLDVVRELNRAVEPVAVPVGTEGNTLPQPAHTPPESVAEAPPEVGGIVAGVVQPEARERTERAKPACLKCLKIGTRKNLHKPSCRNPANPVASRRRCADDCEVLAVALACPGRFPKGVCCECAPEYEAPAGAGGGARTATTERGGRGGGPRVQGQRRSRMVRRDDDDYSDDRSKEEDQAVASKQRKT